MNPHILSRISRSADRCAKFLMHGMRWEAEHEWQRLCTLVALQEEQRRHVDYERGKEIGLIQSE